MEYDKRIFISSQMQIGTLLREADEKTIKSEPMLHRADLKFAMQNGGPLTIAFLAQISHKWLKDDNSSIIIDSRVHMLMPEFFPCIPGWHHDDVPRGREDEQPNYITPDYKSRHVMALWGDCSLTEFALGEHYMEIPPVGQKIYKVLDPTIEKRCQDKKLLRFTAPERMMIYFNWQTWHRGTAATKRGFRFFIRASQDTKLTARNEIRFNANVYLKDLSEGW